MNSAIRLTLAALALPLALSACSDDGATADGGAVVTNEPFDPIAAPEGQEWSQMAEMTPEGRYRIGNPDAPLKLIEYASHSCPACAAFSEDSTDDLHAYVDNGVLSFELRNQIHDVIDLTFATLARCGDPSTFHPLAHQGWADLNGIFERTQANQQQMDAAMQVTDDTRFQRIAEASGLVDWFAARGISRDQAMQCLDGTDTPQQIAERSAQQSEELDVTGTPTFFLNGNKIEIEPGSSAWSQLQPVLEQAGAR